MFLRQLFDRESCTYTYLLADESSGEAMLIDPVAETFDRDAKLIEELGFKLIHTLETHVHADHITAASRFRDLCGSRSVVAAEGGPSCGDVPVSDGDKITFGSRHLVVRTTPGHTDGCLSYVADDQSVVFTGDLLLIRGCGRTDFQSGSPRQLYQSIHEKIFSLPDSTKIYPGHDYVGHTVSTVGEEKRFNRRLNLNIDEDQFVEIMAKLRLDRPKKIDIAVPANLQCGVVPAAKSSGSENASSPSEVSTLTVDELLRRGDGLMIVDVRGGGEYEGELGHIRGSLNCPLDRLPEYLGHWDKSKTIAMICHSGVRSQKATRSC